MEYWQIKARYQSGYEHTIHTKSAQRAQEIIRKYEDKYGAAHLVGCTVRNFRLPRGW